MVERLGAQVIVGAQIGQRFTQLTIGLSQALVVASHNAEHPMGDTELERA